MDIKTFALGVAMASGIVGGASAATTYDFSGSANPSGPFALSCGAEGFLNFGCSVTYNNAGLGVNGNPDAQPGNIDGFPNGSYEELTVTFTGLVNLVSFTLGLFDSNDDFTLITDSGSVQLGPNVTNPFLVGELTSFFTIRASGDGFRQGDSILAFDDFTLRTFTIQPVPVPAAGLLLLGGLGGLAALRRRKA